jgi:uncharacterized Zn finger protein
MWWHNTRKPRVAEQRSRAEKLARTLEKQQGRTLAPVVIEGRRIASSFWGRAWCDNLESYRDFEHRLPRGRSYVRNGAVIDLGIQQGRIDALVSGSALYTVEVRIKALDSDRWSRLKTRSSGQVGSLIELLEGRLSESVMRIMTDRGQGLFPEPSEIQMECSCPDIARMCKHVAAVLYGIGTRLDQEPQLLFLLRHVDHRELISGATGLGAGRPTKRRTIASDRLSDVFGIELAEEPRAPAQRPATHAKRAATRASATGAPVRRTPKKRHGS